MDSVAAWNYLKSWLSSPEAKPPLIVTPVLDLFLPKLRKEYAKHPSDLVEVEGKGSTLSIAEVRELLLRITTTTFVGRRLIIFHQAERLSLPAAQALLKTLEEPATTNRFLLVTRFLRRLPATIRSRSEVLRLPSAAGSKTQAPLVGQAEIRKYITSRTFKDLSDNDLQGIQALIQTSLQTTPGHPAAYRSALRLRDYYKIRAQRGNVKLAATVLLASILDMHRALKN